MDVITIKYTNEENTTVSIKYSDRTVYGRLTVETIAQIVDDYVADGNTIVSYDPEAE